MDKNDKVSLKEKERVIMDILNDLESASKKIITERTDLDEVAVMRASLWLEKKNLVNIKDKSVEEIEISEDGEEILEDGLPEQRVLKHSGYLSEIPVDGQVKNMALGWIRRKNLGETTKKDGKPCLELTEKGKNFLNEEPEEIKALKTIKSNENKINDIDKEILENLKSRGSINVEKNLIKKVSLTEEGKKELEKGFKVKKEVSQLNSDLLKSGEWKNIELKPFNVKAETKNKLLGKKHFVNQAIEYVRQIWLEMGFQEMEGPIIDSSFWVFDALFQPQDHPARDLQDTFYMENPKTGSLPDQDIVKKVKKAHENGGNTTSTGWKYDWDEESAKELILRTHTTSLSARTLSSLDKDDLPAKFFSVGKCFRNEKFDWTHLAEFYQVDGIVVSESVNFQNLLGYLERFLNKMGYEKVRFRPGYFPYTEPSVEAEALHPRKDEWVELLGAGMFRPEVTAPLFGKEINVLAWGPGFGRIMMDYYNIDDIRELYSNDLKHLRNSKLWMRY